MWGYGTAFEETDELLGPSGHMLQQVKGLRKHGLTRIQGCSEVGHLRFSLGMVLIPPIKEGYKRPGVNQHLSLCHNPPCISGWWRDHWVLPQNRIVLCQPSF